MEPRLALVASTCVSYVSVDDFGALSHCLQQPDIAAKTTRLLPPRSVNLPLRPIGYYLGSSPTSELGVGWKFPPPVPSYPAMPQRSTVPQPAPQEHSSPLVKVPAGLHLRPASLAVLSSVNNAPKDDKLAQQSISSRRRLRAGASAVLYAAGIFSKVNPTSELEAHLEFEEGIELGTVANLYEEHAAKIFDAADAKVWLGPCYLL